MGKPSENRLLYLFTEKTNNYCTAWEMMMNVDCGVFGLEVS
jgi:hypothetical protein